MPIGFGHIKSWDKTQSDEFLSGRFSRGTLLKMRCIQDSVRELTLLFDP
jgi:hypothetical protein